MKHPFSMTSVEEFSEYTILGYKKKNSECAQFYLKKKRIKWFELQTQKYRELVNSTQRIIEN